MQSFKPYYKWITFNTVMSYNVNDLEMSFKPYYKWITFNTITYGRERGIAMLGFKPYYKWITFNTR